MAANSVSAPFTAARQVRWHWRWAHILMGIAFLAGAIWAFANPLGAF